MSAWSRSPKGGSGGRELKRFTYDTAPGRGVGKLATALRRNYQTTAPLITTVKITGTSTPTL